MHKFTAKEVRELCRHRQNYEKIIKLFIEDALYSITGISNSDRQVECEIEKGIKSYSLTGQDFVTVFNMFAKTDKINAEKEVAFVTPSLDEVYFSYSFEDADGLSLFLEK